MVAQPQDTTLPGMGGGAGMDPQLQDYLGDSPLYFTISEPVPPGGWMNVELSYVELLPYANARVQLISESDYAQVLNADLPEMTLDISVRSQRAILGIDIAGTGSWSPTADQSYISSDSAYLHVDDVERSPELRVRHRLRPRPRRLRAHLPVQLLTGLPGKVRSDGQRVLRCC